MMEGNKPVLKRHTPHLPISWTPIIKQHLKKTYEILRKIMLWRHPLCPVLLISKMLMLPKIRQHFIRINTRWPNRTRTSGLCPTTYPFIPGYKNRQASLSNINFCWFERSNRRMKKMTQILFQIHADWLLHLREWNPPSKPIQLVHYIYQYQIITLPIYLQHLQSLIHQYITLILCQSFHGQFATS